MRTQLTEQEMKDIFWEMGKELRKFGNTWGQGFSMHRAAKSVAPKWLQEWDDARRWMICFSCDWKAFVHMASDFGYSLERLLADLTAFRDKETAEVLEGGES